MNKIFNVQATLLRNSSVEDHNMNKCLFQQTPVTFELSLNHSYIIVSQEDGIFNVNVDLSIKCFENVGEKDEHVKGEAIYTAKIQHSGIFLIQNFTPEELEVVLAVNCPSIVFPYARAEMNRMLSETQMQKPQLQPVQFDTMYHQKKEKEKNEASEKSKNNTKVEETTD